MAIFTYFDEYECRAIEESAAEIDAVLSRMSSLDSIDNYEEYNFGFTKYQKQHIASLIDLYGFEYDEIIEAIADNRVAAAAIIGKIPSRMGWQEKAQFDSIFDWNETSGFFSSLMKLPNKGDNALYLSHNGFITSDSSLSNTKSIDFLGTTVDGYEFAIAAKYTKDSGGAQDNQRRDLTAFAESAPDFALPNNNTVVVLLADGEFYTHGHRDYNGLSDFYSFIEYEYCLQDSPRGRRNVICTTTLRFDEAVTRFWEELKHYKQ